MVKVTKKRTKVKRKKLKTKQNKAKPRIKAKAKKKSKQQKKSKKRKVVTTKKRNVRRSAVQRKPKKKLTAKQRYSQRSIAAKKAWKKRKAIQAKKQKNKRNLQARVHKAVKFNKEWIAQQRRDPKRKRILTPDAVKDPKFLAGMQTALSIVLEQPGVTFEQASQMIDKAIVGYARLVKAKIDPITTIRSRLIMAEAAGHFDETVYALAEEFGMDPSEIYTQWFYTGAS
jgi:hypothetical protein